MGIVYLALCAVRAFSFIWAEAPIIAMAAAMSVETGDEHDDNAAAAEEEEGEEADIDEDEALLITGSAVVKAAASKLVVKKDDDGTDNLAEMLALEAQRQVGSSHSTVHVCINTDTQQLTSPLSFSPR
jgi:predicted kinase